MDLSFKDAEGKLLRLRNRKSLDYVVLIFELALLNYLFKSLSIGNLEIFLVDLSQFTLLSREKLRDSKCGVIIFL